MNDLNPADIVLREQWYYEAVKQYELDSNPAYGDEIVALIAAILAKLDIDTFQGLTKKRFNEFIVTLNKQLGAYVEKHATDFERRMRKTLDAVVEVTRSNLQKIAEATAAAAVTAANIWNKLRREFIPGAGMTPFEMVKDFGKSTIMTVVRTARQSFASKEPVREFLRKVRGTADRGYKDGVVRKLRIRYEAIVRTFMQFMRNYVSALFGQFYFRSYQWVSVMDSRTTTICRSRHLNIYEYGAGPIPPAHFNCRSVIVGVMGDMHNRFTANTFDQWVKTQPAEFRKDVAQIRRLSPEEFTKRLSTMQME